jgi:hypothetical protein
MFVKKKERKSSEIKFGERKKSVLAPRYQKKTMKFERRYLFLKPSLMQVGNEVYTTPNKTITTKSCISKGCIVELEKTISVDH